MLNKEVFEKDPTSYHIPNDGVARVSKLPATADTDAEAKQWEVAKYECTHFVCQGSYYEGLHRILEDYLTHLDSPTQKAAWVHGASWVYTFRHIMAPLLRPAFMSAYIVLFLSAIRDVVTVALLYLPKSRVLSTVMLDYWQGGAWDRAVVLGLIISLIVIVAAIIARVLGARGEIAG